MTEKNLENPSGRSGFSGLQVLGIVAVVVVATALLTAWWINQNLYAEPFTPTRLDAREQEVLDDKISMLEYAASKEDEAVQSNTDDANAFLEPEPYREDDASREISLSERELNALIANNEETAKYVTVDLADDLVSVKLLIPMNEDVPILGGKTLRLNLGVTLGYENGRPIVAMRGVSLGGVPLPKAWWGDIKNQNLVEQFGGQGGFWEQFSKGIENIKIREGQLWVQLKE